MFRIFFVLVCCIGVHPICAADEGELLEFLLSRKLNLTTDDSSTIKRFQVEFYLKGTCRDRPSEARLIIERDGKQFAAAVLSSKGIARARFEDGAFVLLNDATPGERISILGWPFRFRCGTNDAGQLGYEFEAPKGPNAKSSLAVDVRGLVQNALNDNPEIKFFPKLRKFRLQTSAGTITEISLTPMWTKRGYPVESVVTRTRFGHVVAISVLGTRTPPLRSVIHIDQKARNIPGRTQRAWQDELECLCQKITHEHPLAMQTGIGLVDSFRLDSSIGNTMQFRSNMQLQINSLIAGNQHQSREAAIRNMHKMIDQKTVTPELAERKNCVYSRQAAAHRFEVIFGPVLRSRLDEKIHEAVLDDRYDIAMRCRALSILGCVGVPVHSRALDDIAIELKKKPNADLECVFAAVKLLNSHVSDDNVEQLHRAIENTTLSMPARLCAVEALGLVDDIEGHCVTIEKLLSVPPGSNDQLALHRCARVLAGTSVGRKILSERVHATAGTDALQLPYLSELLFAMEHDDFRANRLVEIAEAVALDEKESPDNRCLAATAVYGGGMTESFALKYAKQAFGGNNHQIKRSAIGALLLAIRQADVSYPFIQQSLRSDDAELRQGAAAAFVSLLRFGKSNADSQTFHKMLHQIFEHEDVEVAYYGIVALHELSQQGVKPPKDYLPSVERVLARTTDRDKVIMGAAAIQAYSDGALSLDFERNQSQEDIEKVRREALRWARQHRRLN